MYQTTIPTIYNHKINPGAIIHKKELMHLSLNVVIDRVIGGVANIKGSHLTLTHDAVYDLRIPDRVTKFEDVTHIYQKSSWYHAHINSSGT